jgi:transcription-repair coupling factor (superfamily II helicase)
VWVPALSWEKYLVTLSLAPTLVSLEELAPLLRQAEGFLELLAALRQGRSGIVDGAWGSSSALVPASLLAEENRTILVVIAHPRELDSWEADLTSFAGIRPAVLPAWDNRPRAGEINDVATQRLRLVRRLASDQPPPLLLTTIQALIQPVPQRSALSQNVRRVHTGQVIDLEELVVWLVEQGYQPAEVVTLPGEFARRGGILDIYPPDADTPCRLEFFGDEIDSLRTFSPETQRSSGEQAEVSLTGALGLTDSEKGEQASFLTGHLCDYFPTDCDNAPWIVLIEPEELQEQGHHYHERITDPVGLFSVPGVFQQLFRHPCVMVSAMPTPTVEPACHLRIESVERFSGSIERVREELDSIAERGQVLLACASEGEQHRLGEVLASGQLAQSDRLRLVTGHVRAGFRLLEPCEGNGDLTGVVVLGSQELFHREDVRRVEPSRRLESQAIDSFLDLCEGDLVVHVSQGIARFRGMRLLDRRSSGRQPRSGGYGDAGVPPAPWRDESQEEEHLILEFRAGVLVYVPASKIDLVQKYVGGGNTDPELSKFGGTGWQRRREKVEEAVQDLASEMLQLQALREAQPGTALPPDSDWQMEFEASFPYQETPDQLTSLAEIKTDLQRARPMDRLICGDVGFGKTELAIRAAFKVIEHGRQVAVLVPTTVLAEQHYRTFSERLAEYPFVVECLSRFRSRGEQEQIVQRLSGGGIDIVIGTHRLVSKDVRFKDLGLVIIDEEQRFGVNHKERLKRLRQTVDVLTMTATPIPRTLHMSLLGIRDISNLETPPPDRKAIETRIVRFDRQLLRHALIRELNREGQVYFVHNRVHNIQVVANQVQQIVPEARVVVAHGQMSEGDLEHAMLRFVRREADVLVATTIIESGLDIPNANTIFINQADQYGLADLHQLRGRVGRYHHRAYAYLLLDADRTVTPVAAKRLKAIEEYTELGSGFRIALRDLEIRGAGNILGAQQSGHIAAVGYELYCQLLENAVRVLKKQPPRTPLEVSVDLPWSAYFPRAYVAGQRQRIETYRRLGRVRKVDRLQDFSAELRDRFGPLPEPAQWLLRLMEVRLLAAHWRVGTIHLDRPDPGMSGPTDLVLGYQSLRRIQRLASRSEARLKVVDEESAYCRLAPEELEPLALYETLRHLLRREERQD